MFAFNDIPLRFLIDHTFFHDIFGDYPHSDKAKWLRFYTYIRYTQNRSEKIIIVPKVIFDKVQFEFPIYRGISHKVIQSIRRIMEIIPMEGINSDLSIIYVASWLLSRDTIPIIISSVSEGKWLDRIKKLGVEIKFEGFTKVMSDRRIQEKFPGVLVDTKKPETKEILSNILSIYDSEYQRVLEIIESYSTQ